MKNGLRIKSLLAIMICSFLLLTGFVSFWLIQRCKQEHVAITNQIDDAMGETQREVVDTLLLKNILQPLLGDSIFSQLRSSDTTMHFDKQIKLKPGDTFIPSDVKQWKTSTEMSEIENMAKMQAIQNLKVSVNVDTDAERPDGKMKKTVTMYHSDSRDLSISNTEEVEKKRSKKTISMTSDTTNIFLLQGMRLILGEIASSNNKNMKVSSDFSVDADTNLLKQVFKKKLEKNSISLPVKWNAIKKGIPFNKSFDKHFVKTTMFAKNYEAQVSGVNLLLFKRLGSQLAFIVLMLGVTALAFILAYRSLIRQERLNTMKNDLINNMSHELKTPVATVKVALEALGDSRVMQNQAVVNEYLGMATLELDRLEMLLGKVLNSSMLDSKNVLINKEPLDLNSLLHDSIAAIKVRADRAGATIYVQLPENAQVIPGDRLHIQGVILNLIDNALKYGGNQPQVKIALRKQANEVILSVSDNGPGIPEEYLGKVFDKFFRVPKGNVHDTKGYGLGLSYARQVMNHHGGSIEVLNLAEGGCRFELHFRA